MGLKILRPDMVPREDRPPSRPPGALPGMAVVRLPGDEENEVKSSDVIAEMAVPPHGSRKSGRVPPPPPRRNSAINAQVPDRQSSSELAVAGAGPSSNPGSESTSEKLRPIRNTPADATQDFVRPITPSSPEGMATAEREKPVVARYSGPNQTTRVSNDSAARRSLRAAGLTVLRLLFRLPLPQVVKDFFHEPTVQRWLLAITTLAVLAVVLLVVLLLR
jgi:hypothetical protein